MRIASHGCRHLAAERVRPYRKLTAWEHALAIGFSGVTFKHLASQNF